MPKGFRPWVVHTRQNGRCYFYNIPMLLPKTIKDPSMPTIDRINNDIGYVKDNIVLSCLAANLGRNTTDHNTFKSFVQLLRESIKND